MRQKTQKTPPPPPGTGFTGGRWCIYLALTGASNFGGGSVNLTTRVEQDNLPPIGATSFNQIWLSRNNELLQTSRTVASTGRYCDITAIISAQGQVTPVGDVTPPATNCEASPAQPDGSNGWYLTIPTVTLSATDSTGWAVASIRYRWDSGVEMDYASPFPASSGSHTLYYYAVDRSGNRESIRSRVFNVDSIPRSVTISSPLSKSMFQHTNGSVDIPVSATASRVPVGGGVELVLDEGMSGEIRTIDRSEPYSYVFSSVGLGEHTVSAYMVDAQVSRLSVSDFEDRIGVGDIIVVMGDSVAAGENDDIRTDDWSADGRNGPYTNPVSGRKYGGFEPILNDILTAVRGYPHSVVNEARSGEPSSGGLSRADAMIARNPTAKTWLICYGTNDLSRSVSSTTYASNIAGIKNKIQAAIPGAVVYIPKIFYGAYSGADTYHGRLGDLIRNSTNVYWGADMETLFKSNHTIYDHPISESGTWIATEPKHHPNGLGIQVMARLWKLALVDRAILVTDGVLPTLGTVWADKIYITGADTIGLGADNWLLVRQRTVKTPPPPPGTSFAGGRWCVDLALTGATDFAGGTINLTTKVEQDNLPPIGATSYNQVWLSRNNELLQSSRRVDSSGRYAELTSTVGTTGQVTPAGDVTPPVTECLVSPPEPDGAGGWYITVPGITLSATDSTGWSVASIKYKWDSGSEITYTGPIQPAQGTHTLYYYAIDRSGNREAAHARTFNVGSP